MHGLLRPETPLPEEKLRRPKVQAEHGILRRLAHDEPERFEVEESRLRRDPSLPVEPKANWISPSSASLSFSGSGSGSDSCSLRAVTCGL